MSSDNIKHLLDIYLRPFIHPISTYGIIHNLTKCSLCNNNILHIDNNPINIKPLEYHNIIYHQEHIQSDIQDYLIQNKKYLYSSYYTYLYKLT